MTSPNDGSSSCCSSSSTPSSRPGNDIASFNTFVTFITWMSRPEERTAASIDLASTPRRCMSTTLAYRGDPCVWIAHPPCFV